MSQSPTELNILAYGDRLRELGYELDTRDEDAHLYELSEWEARDYMRAFLEETEVTCPGCGGEIILSFDNDGYHTWLHEIWRACSCSGIILDFIVDDEIRHEILIVEAAQWMS